MTTLPCLDPNDWDVSLDEAVSVIRGGGLVVLRTDTVYGLAADAFDADAVTALLLAKGRGRQMPPPVLVGDVAVLDALSAETSPAARALIDRFWPGALTVIVRAQPSLTWDLGETGGTVALRMPDDELALALLRRTGPLAVSSANRTGGPPATTAAQARAQLSARVSLYLDGGKSAGGQASTIVDATGPELTVIRIGAIGVEELAEVVPELLNEGGEPKGAVDAEPEAGVAAGSDAERAPMQSPEHVPEESPESAPDGAPESEGGSP